MPLSEFALIERLLSHQRCTRADVPLAAGDDCAAILPPAGIQQLLTTDTAIAGRHFLPEMPPELIAHRALAANLSDLAAVGAQPAWLLCSLNLPRTLANANFIDAFAKGFFTLAARHDAMLIGGNLTNADTLSISITAIGHTPKPIPRSGAQVGDYIFVTGRLGEAAAGLVSLQQTEQPNWLEEKHLRYTKPEPRVEFGIAIRALASALIDCSDGFGQDLTHLLRASGVRGFVDGTQLPRPDWFVGMDSKTMLNFQINGGDDYELIGCCPPKAFAEINKAAKSANISVNLVGFVRENLDDSSKSDNDCPIIQWKNTQNIEVSGYDHFR